MAFLESCSRERMKGINIQEPWGKRAEWGNSVCDIPNSTLPYGHYSCAHEPVLLEQELAKCFSIAS